MQQAGPEFQAYIRLGLTIHGARARLAQEFELGFLCLPPGFCNVRGRQAKGFACDSGPAGALLSLMHGVITVMSPGYSQTRLYQTLQKLPFVYEPQKFLHLTTKDIQSKTSAEVSLMPLLVWS
jgi:hypothetical protein